MEEGKLTDSMGRKVDFKNTIIIMTSNLGADLIKKSSEVGFGAADSNLDYDKMKEKIKSSANKYFKPEFINRLDNLVIFKTLDKSNLKTIVDLELSKLQKRLNKKDITITLDDKAKEFIVDKGYQPEMGARPIKRTIENEIEDLLAEKLLLNPDKKVDFLVTVENKVIAFQEKEKIKEKKEKKEAKTSAK